MKKKLGLIGYPLSHSFSKKHFSDKFVEEKIPDFQYELYPLKSITELPLLLDAEPQLVGLNVTIPYKEKVLSYLDEIDESAKEIGAVNTIRIIDRKLKGFNTDAHGFELSLLNSLNGNLEQQQGLILGTGGASKAVAYVFRKLGITFKYISRQKRNNIFDYKMLDKDIINEHTIIVNTTPLGTYPKTDQAPDIPYQYLNSKHLLYDLVYNPIVTKFLANGQAQNTQIKNGLEMLHLQAERAWEIWND